MILESNNLPIDIRSEDINVIVMDMDTCIGEHIIQNADGSYTMLINARKSYDMQRYCFNHAKKHITSHDWEKFDVSEIEREAHKP